MEEKRIQTRHSLFWPVMLVAFGVVLLMTNLNTLPGNLWDYVAKYWPVLFILGGLDHIYQGKNWVGAVILLGLGGVLLAGNLNQLPWSGLDLLLRLWPVLIVAAGLDLMMQGRTSTLGAVLIVLLAVALVAGMVWIGFAAPGSTTSAPVEINQPLQGAQSASVIITIFTGNANIAGGAEANQLIAGSVYMPNQAKVDESYTVSGGEGRYELKPTSNTRMPVFGSVNGKSTDLKVNSTIPTEIDLTLIAGVQKLDLRSIKTSTLTSETIFGKSIITLPLNGRLSGKAGVIFGELIVRVPRGAAVEFNMDTVIVGKDFPQDFLQEGDKILSPEAASGKADIVLALENVFGRVKIEYLP
ncbi:MAG TPA: DUF5668 domain-containing protein [Longilinea sp.]|nr:DUF5668 domain-containing protein [Longilinea sp.]